MAYTEKVSISGTALSFLLYECINSTKGQEGFLIGDVTSEITNHISDSQNDTARLDTKIVVRSVLPMPSTAMFYTASGKIVESSLSDILSNSVHEVVGWFKYRTNFNIKPTFRDKLIAKGLQRYFGKHHNKKTFVSCNVTNKSTIFASTHTFMYRFGKINCFDMYEYIEDETANLGEKFTGYKKSQNILPNSVFNKIVKETNVENKNTNEGILHIQEAVNHRLSVEARTAVKFQKAIQELEDDIKKLKSIYCQRHCRELEESYKSLLKSEGLDPIKEITSACEAVLESPESFPLLTDFCEIDQDDDVLLDDLSLCRSPSPILVPTRNYAAVLKANIPSTSTYVNDCLEEMEEDVNIEEEKNKSKKRPALKMQEDYKNIIESSPEY